MQSGILYHTIFDQLTDPEFPLEGAERKLAAIHMITGGVYVYIDQLRNDQQIDFDEQIFQRLFTMSAEIPVDFDIYYESDDIIEQREVGWLIKRMLSLAGLLVDTQIKQGQKITIFESLISFCRESINQAEKRLVLTFFLKLLEGMREEGIQQFSIDESAVLDQVSNFFQTCDCSISIALLFAQYYWYVHYHLHTIPEQDLPMSLYHDLFMQSSKGIERAIKQGSKIDKEFMGGMTNLGKVIERHFCVCPDGGPCLGVRNALIRKISYITTFLRDEYYVGLETDIDRIVQLPAIQKRLRGCTFIQRMQHDHLHSRIEEIFQNSPTLCLFRVDSINWDVFCATIKKDGKKIVLYKSSMGGLINFKFIQKLAEASIEIKLHPQNKQEKRRGISGIKAMQNMLRMAEEIKSNSEEFIQNFESYPFMTLADALDDRYNPFLL